MIEDAGHTATPVLGRVLFPLLQAASIEEDEQLRKMWATLLAHAADSERRADMLPSFVSILQALSPVEAVVLEAVYHEAIKTNPQDHHIGYLPEHPTARFNPGRVRIFVELPFRNFRVMADNLARLGLIESQYSGAFYGTEVSNKIYAPLVLTPLGWHFVRECVLPPSREQV
jgi:hypothetical protein